ncbi:helix-turn-helix domain-containing protein [Streptomyces sp. NPDC032940]|uniref:helix-turn-helix domain-containing protein n=1 Tax=Streptomyces sp. NPDC032940 TaxID=3155366 RepID=UPI0033F582CB
MEESADKPKAVQGAEAARIKRETLGIDDRRKHQARKATALKGHAKDPDTHHRLYRFRFYPTEEQARQLQRTFGACRWVYNEGLACGQGPGSGTG